GANPPTATFSGFQEQSHFRCSFETKTRVDGLAKGRCMEEHHGDAARLCESDRFSHDARSVASAAMSRLREHREKIRRGGPFPVRPWLDVHEPDTTAGNGFPADFDDEAGEPIRLHLHLGPTMVDAVRRVEVCFRDLRDRVPHASTMTHEEIQIREGCLTHPAANHGVRIRRRDLSFPYPRRVNLV